ncbi:GTP 3',8-cyclase MoaA [Reichenbachiella ulvae]|uniref:GTP 3',8-cyclase n=1 Tax=Reichenbachiella ulvae TaxID=2980104 RepID=A0ABT3CTT4_9BACT|nr:GTP 3',8-cyclase MoaA [Reichenbachiella ulvae]MCV9386934.1 GTP 3',8-cyclase MoaA [Reichenbachiella ulvae]
MQKQQHILTDNWGRQMDYLRIAITDRCNLRCFYCMPEEGIHYLPKKELLTYEEILRLTQIFSSLGVKKVRITGGEPFIRKDLMHLLKGIKAIEGIESLNITTNGVLTESFIPEMKELGINHVNLSLDSLDPENFFRITRRNEYQKVMSTLDALLSHGIHTKINMVVMNGKNEGEIISMAELARHKNIEVRFIEEMPFNGSETQQSKIWSAPQILETLRSHYPNLTAIQGDPHAPATQYTSPELNGSIGIIAAYSRSFCHGCNRIRLTATGTIKNCLYDNGVLDLKELMRSGTSDDQIKETLISTVKKKEKDGIIAEANRQNDAGITESMSTIGG